MDYGNTSTILIVLGIIAITLEIIIGAATGFELFVVGVIMIIGGIVAGFTSATVAFISMAVLTIGYLVFGRSMLKKSLHITTHATNVESIIGETALVTESIAPDVFGKVKVNGEVWRAESSKKIEAGAKVRIVSVSGVTLKVE